MMTSVLFIYNFHVLMSANHRSSINIAFTYLNLSVSLKYLKIQI